MPSKNIRPQGVIVSQKLGIVPIYGLESLPLTKTSNWQLSPANAAAVQVVTWVGDEPFSVRFDFKLTAGIIPEAPTRQQLCVLMRRFQAMASYVKDQNGYAQPPPPVRLVIGTYINCTGMLRCATCTPTRPWSTQDQTPTTCTFSVDFLAAPSYDGKLVTAPTPGGQLTQAFDSKTVASKYFRS